jgi:hypothetical protein
MRPIIRGCTLLVITGWLICFIGAVKGTDAIRAQDLSGLPQADRVAVMKAALERRIDRVRNIDVVSETRIYNRKVTNGRLGDQNVADSGWYEFHTQHLDGSYRVKTRWYDTQSATKPDSTAVSHHDAKTGVTRILSEQKGSKGMQGRIGNDHLPSMHSNRAVFHLLGGSFVINPVVDRSDFLLESLASCSPKWQVDVNVREQQVVISHPYTIAFCETGTGTRKVFFDCAKGMMPMRIELDYRDERLISVEPRRTIAVWLEARTVMTEPKDFGGIWFPMRIEERIRANSAPPGVCSVLMTTVKQLTLGNLKDADLPITFPPGTEVADALKQVFYRTGPDGEPKGSIYPIGIPEGPLTLDSEGNIVVPKRPSWMLRAGLWSAGVGVVLLLCLFVLRKFRAHATQ